MPLIIAPTDTNLSVVKISTDEKTKKHLESLGITINSIIRILSHSGGSTICLIKDTRLALDRSVTTKIFVV